MRSDYIILPDDQANVGKRHKTLVDGSTPALHVPRVADHLDPGVLDGEYTYRMTLNSITTARSVCLFNPPDSGIEVEVIGARWRFYISSAQVAATWLAMRYTGVAAVANPQTSGDVLVGARGESRARKATHHLPASITLPGPAVLAVQVPVFVAALPIDTAGVRAFDLTELGCAIALDEGEALLVPMIASPSAGQYIAQISLTWREWLR